MTGKLNDDQPFENEKNPEKLTAAVNERLHLSDALSSQYADFNSQRAGEDGVAVKSRDTAPEVMTAIKVINELSQDEKKRLEVVRKQQEDELWAERETFLAGSKLKRIERPEAEKSAFTAKVQI